MDLCFQFVGCDQMSEECRFAQKLFVMIFRYSRKLTVNTKKELLFMGKLGENYRVNVATIDSLLHPEENFDVIRKVLKIGQDEMTLYYIDGFVNGTPMQKLMMHFLSLDSLKTPPDSVKSAAERFVEYNVPHVEAETTGDVELMVQMVLSGASLILGSTFGPQAIIVDARTYPARSTEEPEGDRVMVGSRDGFVETLIFNTALLRRRVRDPQLTMQYFSVGRHSKTDVVLCYLANRANPDYVRKLQKRLASIDTDALPLGHQSLAECLIKTRWYNPFPKIRYTERPDTAAAQVLEGSVLIFCDNSPQVMILPVSIFDFMQETNDYYFTPLTGTYIRVIRYIVFALSLFLVPSWYLLISHADVIPAWLSFIVPEESGRIPIIAQLLLTEFIIDGLRMASLNTPSMLSNSLSVVGGLILGDFAVGIGWLVPEVILYMAFVAIATFTQRSYELGYAFKFLRIGLLIMTAIFGVWGYAAGTLLIVVLLATNKTVNGGRRYLYPLIPFDAKALLTLLVRRKKQSDIHATDRR